MNPSGKAAGVRARLPWLCAAVLALVAAGCGAGEPAASGPTLGPPPDVVIVRGPVAATAASTFEVTTADGPRTVRLEEKTGYGVLVDADLGSIGPGDFIGVTSQRLPDGGLEAVEVHVFPESMRGAGKGHYPWDIPRPGGTTMTNAEVAAAVSDVDGPVLTLSLDGQDIPITVPAAAPVVRIDLRKQADVLQVGHGVVAVTRQAEDGALVALRVYTRESGAMPAL